MPAADAACVRASAGLHQAATASVRPRARSALGARHAVELERDAERAGPQQRAERRGAARSAASYSSSHTFSAPTSTCRTEHARERPRRSARRRGSARLRSASDDERQREQRRDVHERAVGQVDVHEPRLAERHEVAVAGRELLAAGVVGAVAELVVGAPVVLGARHVAAGHDRARARSTEVTTASARKPRPAAAAGRRRSRPAAWRARPRAGRRAAASPGRGGRPRAPPRGSPPPWRRRGRPGPAPAARAARSPHTSARFAR